MALDDILKTADSPAGNPIREPLTRAELYALVWSEPMLKVGARLGVSSSYMARICTLLKVPRPERGYWLLDRLKRARELIGTVDALDHFMIWKSPEER